LFWISGTLWLDQLILSSIVARDSISNTKEIKTWGKSYKYILFNIKQQIEVLTTLRRNNV